MLLLQRMIKSYLIISLLSADDLIEIFQIMYYNNKKRFARTGAGVRYIVISRISIHFFLLAVTNKPPMIFFSKLFRRLQELMAESMISRSHLFESLGIDRHRISSCRINNNLRIKIATCFFLIIGFGRIEEKRKRQFRETESMINIKMGTSKRQRHTSFRIQKTNQPKILSIMMMHWYIGTTTSVMFPCSYRLFVSSFLFPCASEFLIAICREFSIL